MAETTKGADECLCSKCLRGFMCDGEKIRLARLGGEGEDGLEAYRKIYRLACHQSHAISDPEYVKADRIVRTALRARLGGTRTEVQRWRDDAFEAAAKIAERYGANPHAVDDIRALKRGGTVQPERERHGWPIERGVECVVCPGCAFTMSATHVDASDPEHYTCPSCRYGQPEDEQAWKRIEREKNARLLAESRGVDTPG